MREVVPSLHRSDVLRIAEYVKAHKEKLIGVKVALVATTASTFGMAQEQKAALSGSPVEMEVFWEMDAASEWLGLAPEAE